ncbi:C10orf67 [Bugula neritina]|nr:C10orf67 [Bugula neritina]
MTNVLQVLIKDSSHIKRDLTLTRKKLETEYENKLQEKSLDLYTRINHKLGELEAMHIERVGIVRRAYRQQLADALARVETLFQARFEKQMEKDKERHQLELRKLQQQVSSLTQTIQRNESVIIMLKQQLATKQKIEEPPPREDTTKIDALTKQMDSLKEQLKSKDKEIGTMEDELDNKNAEITSTTERCNKLQNELEKENILRSQLAMELAEMKSQAEKSSSEARRLLEKQRQEMEIAAEEKARKAREEALGATGQKMREMQAEFAQRIGELMKEKERLEQQLVQERERPQATPPKAVVQAPETDFDELVKSERELRVHVEKLRKEIERINRAWEKKFTILQASLYALKDESYLRQHLEKQHTALRQATISYTAGPSKTGNRRPVLPSIPNRAASPDPLASYTVSRASNRHLLENQIISDEEEDMIYGQNIGLNNQSRFSSQSIA